MSLRDKKIGGKMKKKPKSKSIIVTDKMMFETGWNMAKEAIKLVKKCKKYLNATTPKTAKQHMKGVTKTLEDIRDTYWHKKYWDEKWKIK